MLIVSISREKIEDELIGKNPFAIVLLCVFDDRFLFILPLIYFVLQLAFVSTPRVEGEGFSILFFYYLCRSLPLY
jgi:hypothetical protein